MSDSDEKIYTKSLLPYSGSEVLVLEGNGDHYFEAFGYSNGIPSLLVKSLTLQLVKINGKIIRDSDLQHIHIRDMVRIVEIVNSMLSEL